MNMQAKTFRKLRWRLWRNGIHTLLETGRVRLLTILATSFFVAAFVFALAYFGFLELAQNRVPFKGLIVSGLFDGLFFTLGGMLLLSTGVILYASLFTSPEARYLLTTPAFADRIFAVKFSAAIAFSSWGFVVLGLPILIAYGLVAKVPWFFYPLLPAFLIGFVLLPGAVSSLACLLLMRFLPRNRKQSLYLLGGGLVFIIAFWLYRTSVTAQSALETGGRDALQGFVERFALAQHPLSPSHWMTNGLLAAARGDLPEALRPLALLWSNGLLVYLVAAFTSRRLYRTAYDRATGGGHARRKYRGQFLDRIMEGLVFYLDKPTRVLVVKDFRTFRRDPSQWALLAIFAVMIAIGAGNFRSYYTEDLAVIDQYIIGLVNLAGTAVLLCAGLSRFIFPLISLEGRKFWILGLMPIQRRQILAGKFAYAATGSLLIALMLVLGSELMLGMSGEGLFIHAVAITAIALGLSGLNVGLGAYLPNFRETDPSKIVVGFSGTVNMVLGLLFLVTMLALMAGPLHVAAVQAHFAKDLGRSFPWWIYAGLPAGIVIAMLATWLPLRMGRKALEATEF
jgi:ABC-2 type transport system permease protein